MGGTNSPDLDRHLLARFGEVVDECRDDVAVRSESGVLTYGELDRRSNAIANEIVRRVGTGPEPVATLLPPGAAGVAGIVGTLKSGRPCLPLDPHAPAARLGELVDRAGPRAVLADGDDGRDGGASGFGECTAIHVGSGREDDDGPGLDLDPDAGATLLFTSGSTGRPKGVLAPSRLWSHGAMESGRELALRRGDRLGVLAPLAFHLGMSGLWIALLNGWELDPLDPLGQPLALFPEWIDANALDGLILVPSLLRALVSALAAGRVFDRLHVVVTGGESLLGRDVEESRHHVGPSTRFVSRGAASETGVVAFFPVEPGASVTDGAIPFGTPVGGVGVSVRREDGSEAVVGERGELVVSASHLAVGYWNDPELTAARFTIDTAGSRSYRTGDLVRRDGDGCLAHLGRLDAMVKVRGSLVEPTEVESKLVATGTVREAAVVGRLDARGDTRLVAYVVPAVGKQPSPASLRRALASQLPTYMVPQTIVQLAELPRNARGKTDRAALPDPSGLLDRPRRSPVPGDEIDWQLWLASLWCDVLGVDEVFLDDDFFELGGDSLAAEEMLAELTGRLGVTFDTATLLENPTLEQLAACAMRPLQTRRSTLVPIQTSGSRAPLFCVAGAGSRAVIFLTLARRLGPEQPVYGLQPHGIEYRALPDWSMAAAARRQIRALKTVQPHGPYSLLGHSAGGPLAFEMARRLTSEGEQVAVLALLDSPAPVGDSADAEAVPAPTTNSPGGTRRTRRAAHRARAALTLLSAGIVRRAGARQDDLFFRVGQIVTRRYRPRDSWDGTALVVWADDAPSSPAELGWDRLITGPVEAHRVPGGHTTILHEPHVRAVADLLRKALDEASLAPAGRS